MILQKWHFRDSRLPGLGSASQELPASLAVDKELLLGQVLVGKFLFYHNMWSGTEMIRNGAAHRCWWLRGQRWQETNVCSHLDYTAR